MTTIKINFAPLIGWPVVIYQAFKIWESPGMWLAIGALLCDMTLSLTFQRRS